MEQFNVQRALMESEFVRQFAANATADPTQPVTAKFAQMIRSLLKDKMIKLVITNETGARRAADETQYFLEIDKEKIHLLEIKSDHQKRHTFLTLDSMQLSQNNQKLDERFMHAFMQRLKKIADDLKTGKSLALKGERIEA
jgi:hypothetical protein